jgi:curved DNA-binding protein CbpA
LADPVIIDPGDEPEKYAEKEIQLMRYPELCTALEEFGFSERVSLGQIKERYRDLVRRYHPDRGVESDPEKIRRINEAYRILRSYCHDYLFDCSYQEFLEQYPEERLREQFGVDSLWGGRSEDI